MVGITLLPEQVRAAPPEVRRWLEQQIAMSLGLLRPAPPIEAARHLVGCDVRDIRAVLARIQIALPLVNVLFELAREPAVVTPQGMRVLHIDDMMRHCRLESPNQVGACLEQINQILQQTTGDDGAAMVALDPAGHCIVADITSRSIMAVWQEIISVGQGFHSAQPGTMADPATGQSTTQPPYAVSVPVSSAVVGSGPG